MQFSFDLFDNKISNSSPPPSKRKKKKKWKEYIIIYISKYKKATPF